MQKTFLFILFIFFSIITLILPFIVSDSDISGRLGLFIWMFFYLILLVFGVYSLFRILKWSLVYKSFFALISLLVIIFASIYSSTITQNVSHETTHQVACGLNWQQQEFGQLFSSTCFLGYPARTYVLMAIPSYIFGRSVFSLNLGVNIFVLSSISVLTFGLLSLFGQNPKITDKATSIGLLLILQFGYINQIWFHSFEQSILPFAFTAYLLGLLMLYLKNSQIYIFILIALTLLLSFYSYTPALAIPLLFLIYTPFLVKMKESKHKLLLIMILFGICLLHLAYSVSFREDIRFAFHNENNSSLYLILSRNELESLLSVFYKPIYNVLFVSPLAGLIILTTIIISIRNNKYLVPLLIWIGMVFIASYATQGYTYYPAHFRIHRLIMTAPALILFVVYGLTSIKMSHYNMVLLFIIGLTFFQSLIFLSNQFNSYHPDNRVELSLYIQKLVSDSSADNNSNFSLSIYDSQDYHNYASISDISRYFAPQVTINNVEPSLYSNACDDRANLILMSFNSFSQCLKLNSYPFSSHKVFKYTDTREADFYVLQASSLINSDFENQEPDRYK